MFASGASCRGGDDEHVDRGHVVHVVVQEVAPSWGGDLGSPRHVSPNGGLADLNTEHEQFAVNARRPQMGLAMLIWRISFRISVLVFGRPIWRDLDRHRQ